MATEKHVILGHIRQLAELNDGVPPGRRTFAKKTGISSYQWAGVHWLTWNEALVEAGFPPNSLCKRISDEFLLESLAKLIRKAGHFPTRVEMRYYCLRDPELPNHWPILRLGKKAELIARVLDFCERRSGFDDVAKVCVGNQPQRQGYVYLARYDGRYKIGQTINLQRRERELTSGMPDELEMVHTIQTDDPRGVEAYWHKRFADKRIKGEWFALDEGDVQAFMQRKTM